VEVDGLASGPNVVEVYRLSDSQGAKPDEPRVVFPRKLDFVLNLMSAKALQLTIPRWLIARTNEIIE
jgi:hypothetical protein